MDGDEITPEDEMIAEGGTGTPTPAVDYQKMFETMQAQNAALAAQNAQLAQTVQQVAARPVVQQPVNVPNPLDAFDDKAKAALQAVIDQQNANFKAQFAQQEQRFAGMALEQEANSIAAIPNLDPAIAKRAQEVFKQERARGVPLNASNAVDFAIGEAVRNGTFKGNVPSQHQNRAPNTLVGGGRPPAAPKARPANFDRMSRTEQIKHFESDDNIHNTPLGGMNYDDAE